MFGKTAQGEIVVYASTRSELSVVWIACAFSCCAPGIKRMFCRMLILSEAGAARTEVEYTNEAKL